MLGSSRIGERGLEREVDPIEVLATLSMRKPTVPQIFSFDDGFYGEGEEIVSGEERDDVPALYNNLGRASNVVSINEFRESSFFPPQLRIDDDFDGREEMESPVRVVASFPRAKTPNEDDDYVDEDYMAEQGVDEYHFEELVPKKKKRNPKAKRRNYIKGSSHIRNKLSAVVEAARPKVEGCFPKGAYLSGFSKKAMITYIETGHFLNVVAMNYRDKIYSVIIPNTFRCTRRNEIRLHFSAYSINAEGEAKVLTKDLVELKPYTKKKDFVNPSLSCNKEGIVIDFMPNFKFITKRRTKNLMFYLLFVTLSHKGKLIAKVPVFFKKRAEGGVLEDALKETRVVSLVPGSGPVRVIDVKRHYEKGRKKKMMTRPKSKGRKKAKKRRRKDFIEMDQSYEVIQRPSAIKRKRSMSDVNVHSSRKRQKTYHHFSETAGI